MTTTMMMLIAASVVASAADDFPGSSPDRRLLKTQQKVDSLFEQGDFERAYFIYREELAPLGDKYAQYMVGYMNMTGKGVEKDYVTGLTWYRLAAERGDKNFSKARDEVWALFNDEQRRQSNKMYGELRWKLSDAMIVAKLVEQDLAIVEKPAPANSLSLSADEDAVLEADQEELAAKARKRLMPRLKYLRAALISTREMSVAETERVQKLLQRAETLLN